MTLWVYEDWEAVIAEEIESIMTMLMLVMAFGAFRGERLDVCKCNLTHFVSPRPLLLSYSIYLARYRKKSWQFQTWNANDSIN